MKKILMLILSSGVIFALNGGEESSCPGHTYISEVMDSQGVFEDVKAQKEKWEEKKSYDRNIESCKCDLYKEGQWWVKEYTWRHKQVTESCKMQQRNHAIFED